MSSTPNSTPAASPNAEPQNTGFLHRIHRWGVQNPKWYYIGPPSVWAVLIYVVSIAPIGNIDALAKLTAHEGDKFFHALFYAFLSMLILRGWQREKMPPLGLHGFVFLLCLAFGGTIEIQQAFIPYRSADYVDLLADGAGALVGQVAWHLMMIRWGKRTKLYPGLLRPDFKQSEPNRRNK